jgi:hypothetical protein
MENRDYLKIRREALRQGWRARAIKSGEMLLSPDGIHAATWHRTPSAQDAIKRFVRELRLGGFVWPPE